MEVFVENGMPSDITWICDPNYEKSCNSASLWCDLNATTQYFTDYCDWSLSSNVWSCIGGCDYNRSLTQLPTLFPSFSNANAPTNNPTQVPTNMPTHEPRKSN